MNDSCLIELSLALGIMCEMYECRCKTQKPHKTSMEQNKSIIGNN